MRIKNHLFSHRLPKRDPSCHGSHLFCNVSFKLYSICWCSVQTFTPLKEGFSDLFLQDQTIALSIGLIGNQSKIIFPVILSLTHSTTFEEKTLRLRLVTFTTFDQSDEET